MSRFSLFWTMMCLCLTSLSQAATYTVSNNTANSPATANSLDWALAQATSNPGADIIVFSTSLTINDVTLSIPSDVTLDGSSGYASFCTNGPRVILTSNGTPSTVTLTSLSNVTIKGLSFQGIAVSFASCTNLNIYGNWFGMNAAGTGADTNPIGWSGSAYFVTISNSTNVVMGGTACDERNVISLNDGSNGNGVTVSNTQPFTFKGNYLGTEKTGLTGIGITAGSIPSSGITLNGCGTAGSAVIVSDNVISVRSDGGNGGPNGNGILLKGINTNLTVDNNKIGVDANGAVDATIYISASGVRIEGTLTSSSFTNNIIAKAGAAGGGDQAKNSGMLFLSTTVSTLTISNNLVGIDNAGANAGNGFCGIYFFNATTSSTTISDNVIGYNGFGGTSQFGSGIALVGLNVAGITVTGNYIGVSPTNVDIGNANDGMIIQDGPHNLTIGTTAANGRNYISFNRGMRITSPGGSDPAYVREPNAAIMMYNVQDVVIKNNGIGITPSGGAAGQSNVGGCLIGGTGIIVQGSSTRRVTIGGMAANEQNIIAYNSGRGIMVIQGADFVQMEWNSIYCNTDYGIDINCRGQYGVGSANGGYGCPPAFSLNTFTPPVSSVSGIRPSDGVVDVFGTNACASGACKQQGQYRYTGTYTYPTGTTWNYNNGSTMYDDISALVTGSNATNCNSGVCRTSEYSNCVDTPLPVDWLSFEVTTSGATNHLVWVTAKEKNNDYFVIERSVNGETYEVIGEVEGAGNSSVALTYQFDDVTNLSGIIYYRIRQVDLNGKYSYSPVRTVEKDAFVDVVVAPVPNNGSFNVELFGFDGVVNVTVTDVIGRSVYATSVTVQGYELLPVQLNVTPGVYLVNVLSGTERKVIRITVE